LIERHITFTVPPQSTAAFERFITEEYGPAMAKSPGFVRFELLLEAGALESESTTRYRLVFRFRDADSAAGWRTSETHAALQPALKALHTDMDVQSYKVLR
jgi:antibiotic biosynthesis monooxygenase (ABM) superfamily enzyme